MGEWRKTFGDSRPKTKEPIIILTTDSRVMRGYMSESVWPGEDHPTYAYHGEYYDFTKHEIIHCLVNALAWMPLPDIPKIRKELEYKEDLK